MARRAGKPVTFEIMAPGANKVLLAGDFTSWDKSTVALEKDKKGIWKTEVNLKPGKHQYKFVVDGKWVTDPTNKATVRNAFGSENSLREVTV
jgi:1,4-alpha-glucan branching enzyme